MLPREWQERYELVVAVFQVPAWSAALEPVEAVEDEVERERELGVLIAWSEGTTVGDREAAARALARNGTFIPNSVGYTGGLFAGLPMMARAVLMGLGSTSVRLVRPAVNRENLAALRQLLETGEVRVVIAQTYPLDQAAAAVTRMLEHHPSGKIAITV